MVAVAPSETRSHTILIAEDEVLVRIMVAEALRDAGYAVIEAIDADEAIRVLRTSADVKLLISDIRMPGSMDGVALARVVRAEHPGVKVLLVSGDLTGVCPTEHDGAFLKPYNVSRLLRAVENLLASGTA
ncbi:MAG TPA: response regulator [Xanthobacteraceae bacterium]|jgi:DNA-binding NtrC family response regulator